MRYLRSICMRCRSIGGFVFGIVRRQLLAFRVPATLQHGVVGIRRNLLPCVEFNSRKCSVWQLRSNETVQRIIPADGGHTCLNQILFILECKGATEEGLILLDRVPLVIEDCAAATHPA